MRFINSHVIHLPNHTQTVNCQQLQLLKLLGFQVPLTLLDELGTYHTFPTVYRKYINRLDLVFSCINQAFIKIHYRVKLGLERRRNYAKGRNGVLEAERDFLGVFL